eukprot:TRINITY_DN1280_c0_g1_i1.p1 TRINITY_DN1280_c0_g1~~TRINITY_DN1280_c0_g1_i1.p1  ORF type:complete len:122 (-),score=11.43 TRINITY_DN1280_c0_g1_i1:370-735(-)
MQTVSLKRLFFVIGLFTLITPQNAPDFGENWSYTSWNEGDYSRANYMELLCSTEKGITVYRHFNQTHSIQEIFIVESQIVYVTTSNGSQSNCCKTTTISGRGFRPYRFTLFGMDYVVSKAN